MIPPTDGNLRFFFEVGKFEFSPFGYQEFVVPDDVYSVTVDMAGAAGGDGVNGSVGGNGTRLKATVSVTPGQKLFVFVGGKGGRGSIEAGGVAGFNGGASGSVSESLAGGGGGGESYQ